MSSSKFPLNWTGVYEYDYNSNVDLETPDPVTFRINFEFFNDTEFTGQVCDSVDSPMPEPGTVKGRLIGNSIEFVKLMPIATYIEPEGGTRKFECSHP